jgi:mannose-6-phosphate isomerase-like protein (cupin superfamily)
MKAFHTRLKETVKENERFREVLFTGEHGQLVVMSLKPGEEIGEEVHEVDQFIYVVQGSGKAELDGEPYEFEKGDAIFVPAGVRHNVISGDEKALKLFTLYAPPQHPVGTVPETRPVEATAGRA